MVHWIVSSAQRLFAECSQYRTPSQIAWGLALGVSLGLIPMDNLASLLLIGAVLFLPVNQLASAAAFLVIAPASTWIQFLPNSIGGSILSSVWVRGFLGYFAQFPVVPWLRLNNTQVIGGILFGTMTLIPNYLVARWSVLRLQRRLAALAMQQLVGNATELRKLQTDSKAAVTQHSNRIVESESSQRSPTVETSPTRATTTGLVGESLPSNTPIVNTKTMPVTEKHSEKSIRIDVPVDVASGSTTKPSSSLDTVRSDQETQSTPTQPVSRIARPITKTIEQTEFIPNTTQTVLRETIIEVVRYRKAPVDANTTDTVKPTPLQATDQSESPMLLETQPAKASMSDSTSVAAKSEESNTNRPSEPHTAMVHPTLSGTRGPTSLRYLIRHITNSRDTQKESESTK